MLSNAPAVCGDRRPFALPNNDVIRCHIHSRCNALSSSCFRCRPLLATRLLARRRIARRDSRFLNKNRMIDESLKLNGGWSVISPKISLLAIANLSHRAKTWRVVSGTSSSQKLQKESGWASVFPFTKFECLFRKL